MRRFFPILFVAASLYGQAQAPVVVSVSPSSGSNANQVFTVTVSDSDGVADIDIVNLLINDALDGRAACYLAFRPTGPASGHILLVKDAGDANQLEFLPMPGDGPGTVSNSQCSVTNVGSSLSINGNTLTVSLNLSVKTDFGGNRLVYAAAIDKGGRNSGWKARAVWAVPPAKQMDPMVVSMAPARGTTNTGRYTFRFQDSTGASNLNVVNVLVNDFVDGRVACYFAYIVGSRTLAIVEDFGNAGALSGGVLGTADVVGNSQCSTNLATATATVSGTNLDLALDLTFTDKLAGDRIFYLAARGSDESRRNSGWQPKGTVGFAPAGLSTQLLSVTPKSANQGATATLAVSAIGTSFAAGAVAANLGAGVTVNSTTVNSATSLTLNATIAADAVLGNRNLKVTHGGRSYQLADALAITSTGGVGVPPVISSFSPASGSAGTLVTVTVTGSNLSSARVAINAQGGGTLACPVTAVASGSLQFVIPPGAATGPIQVSSTDIPTPVLSATPLTIVPSSSFSISATPGTVTLVRGFSAAFAVNLTGTNNFPALAELAVAGLPAGVTAVFKPPRIGAGQASVLTLQAPPTQALGTANLNVSASAVVDGAALNSAASVSVQVAAPTTSFAGRTVVADDAQTPLAGVTVTFLGKDGNGGNTSCSATAKSDAAGNFLIANLPVGCTGQQLVGFDGLTVTSPAGKYAGVNVVFTLVAGQLTASPVLVHLPRIDNKETFLVTQNSPVDQTYSYTSIPGLSLTVYAGTTLTLPDGTRPNPFPLVAVQVPVDRLPDAKPSVPTMMSAFIVAFQPANSRASQPVAVFYPNTVFTPPGTSMTMMTLNPTRGRMVPYGTGRVSANGLSIVPDLDPAYPGKRYGIVDFDWHGPMPPPPNGRNPGPGGNGTGNSTGGCSAGGGDGQCGGNPGGGDPVDISSGLQIVKSSDISITGSRGRIAIDRVYRSGTTNAGSFGIGMQFEYDWGLSNTNIAGLQAVNLITPDGNQFLMSRQPNGTFTNTALPFLKGAVLSAGAGNTATLRWKDGSVYGFEAFLLFDLLRLTSITDANGNKITLTRNAVAPAQILSITDPVGRSLALLWDSSNRVTKVTDPIGRQVTYTYNAAGSLETVTDPAGGVTRYEYNADRNMIRMFDKRGVKVFENVYDGPQVTKQTLANGGVYQFGYGFLIVIPGGGGPGSIGPRPGESLGSTACLLGCPTTLVTDPLGRQTAYRFNWQGFVVSVTDALGKVKRFDRDPGTNELLAMTGDGQCAVCGPPGAGDLTFTYDANGNRLSKTDALGNVTRYEYEPVFNRQTRLRNALGQDTVYAYDAKGNLLSVTDAKGNVTSFAYDAFGAVAEVTDATLRKTTFTYNATGDLVRVTDPLGNAQEFRYDPVSRMIKSTDRMGRKSNLVYDVLNRVVTQRDGRRLLTQFRYDAEGHLLEVKDARNNSTLFAYDVMGRQISKTAALGKTSTWTRDLMGNVTRYVDRRGQNSDFIYDDLYRVTRETYQDGARVDRIYDPRSRLIEVTDTAAGTFKLAYDAAGELASTSAPTGTVSYTRDALRRVSERQVAGQPPVTYAYDTAGNLISAGSTPASATFAYDARNLMVGQTYSNGVNSSFVRDALGRVQTINHQKGAAILYTQDLQYDPEGNPLRSGSNAPQPLATSAAVATFDNENRLLTRNGVTYTYDDEGNRVSTSGPGGTNLYSWDTRGRLVSIFWTRGASTTMKYDYRGLMIEKQEAGGIPRTERYLLDDVTNTVWMSQSGQSTAVLTGRSVDSHLAVSGGSSGTVFRGADLVNSTVLTTDAFGAPVGQFSYEPFGQTASPLPLQRFPFMFTGRAPTEAGVSLSYHRYRHYDTSSAVFISQDPIGFDGGDVNLYRYVGNGPTDSLDALGLRDFTVCEMITMACIPTYFLPPTPATPVCLGMTLTCVAVPNWDPRDIRIREGNGPILIPEGIPPHPPIPPHFTPRPNMEYPPGPPPTECASPRRL